MHSGDMASSHHPYFFESLAPHPGSPAHAVSYIVHQLGYWPEDSVVLVLADTTLGPLVRIDSRQECSRQESIALITHFVQTLSEKPITEDKLPYFLLAVFGPNTPTRRRQLENNLNQPPCIEEIETDRLASALCAYWQHVGIEVASVHQKTLLDVLYIGEVSYWRAHRDTHEMMLSGFIDEVQRTDVYLNLLLAGSCVAPCELEAQKHYLPSLEKSRDVESKNWWEEEMVLWLKEYLQHIKTPDSAYAQDFLTQKYYENILWNHALIHVIETINQYQRTDSAEFADAIRKILDPHLIAFLGATLTSELSAQSVIYTVALGIDETSSLYQKLSSAYKNYPTHEILCPLGYEQYLRQAKRMMKQKTKKSQQQDRDMLNLSLEKFASVLLGKHRIKPDPQRIAAMEILCALILRAYEKPDTARAYVLLAWGSWAIGQGTKAREYLRKVQEQLPTEELFLKNIEQLPPWLGGEF